MGRPSKICGSDAAGGGGGAMTSSQRCVQSSSPPVLSGPGAGGYVVGSASMLQAAASAAASVVWRPTDDRLIGLHHHDWTVDHLHRTAADAWNASEFSDSGTGGLLTDDAASLEPSPKRRHSDSYASSSSPYQFSPPPSGSGSSDVPRAGSQDGSERSRQSSMSSQDAAAAAAYHWSTTPSVTVPPATTYGVLRMSGGEMLQRVALSAGGPSPLTQDQDVYMHWNIPLPTATTAASTPVKPEETVGGDVEAFQAREMSDVIENIIRQQQQHQQQPGTAGHVLSGVEYPGLRFTADSRDAAVLVQQPHYLQQQAQPQPRVVTTGAVFRGQSTHQFIPSIPPLTAASRPVLDAVPATSITVDAADWINQLPDELSNDTGPDTVPSCLSDEEPDPDIEAQVQAAMSYWLHPDLPDENVMLADRHWDVLNRVVPAYNRFVQFGTNVNRKLKIKFDVSLCRVIHLRH